MIIFSTTRTLSAFLVIFLSPVCFVNSNEKNYSFIRVSPTDLHIYNLDAVPPVYVVCNHADTDKLTIANGGTFTSSSASLSNQSR